MEPDDDLARRLLAGRLHAAAFAAACVQRDGQIVYEDGEPKGEGVPERYAIDYEAFVDPEGIVDCFEQAPLSTKRGILDVAAAFVEDHPERVAGFLPHLVRCLALQAESVAVESTAMEVIEAYADHLRDAGADLPDELARTVPILVQRLDDRTSEIDHRTYGGTLIHIERVDAGVLAPYLDVFAHPEHNRGERHSHVPSRPVESIEANPDGASRAVDRAIEQIIDRRDGSHDEADLADDVVAVRRLLEYVDRSERHGAVLSDRTVGLLRGLLETVRETAGTEQLREATGEALAALAAVEAERRQGE